MTAIDNDHHDWNVEFMFAMKAMPILTTRRTAMPPIRKPLIGIDLLRAEVCLVVDHFSWASCR